MERGAFECSIDGLTFLRRRVVYIRSELGVLPREAARDVPRAPDGSTLALVPPIQTKLFGRLQLALDHLAQAIHNLAR